jgi:hypothetical protein
MENNILNLGLLLPMLAFFLFDTMQSLARFLAGERVFLFCVPFFRVAEKDCEHNLSYLRRKKAHTFPIAVAFFFSIGDDSSVRVGVHGVLVVIFRSLMSPRPTSSVEASSHDDCE